MPLCKIFSMVCLALILSVGPTTNTVQAQGCFGLELALDHATAAWDAAFQRLAIADAEVDRIHHARHIFRQQNPTAPWPFGLTDGDYNRALFARSSIWSQMDDLEATINSLLDQLLDCEDPPSCDGAGHIH